MGKTVTINRETAGYTILVLDKYILCGTAQASQFKPIDNLGTSKIRQYYSIKILLNNIKYHFHTWGSREFSYVLDSIMHEHGWVKETLYYSEGSFYRPDYSNKEALKYLIETGIVKIVKINQVLNIEDPGDILKELK